MTVMEFVIISISVLNNWGKSCWYTKWTLSETGVQVECNFTAFPPPIQSLAWHGYFKHKNKTAAQN